MKKLSVFLEGILDPDFDINDGAAYHKQLFQQISNLAKEKFFKLKPESEKKIVGQLSAIKKTMDKLKNYELTDNDLARNGLDLKNKILIAFTEKDIIRKGDSSSKSYTSTMQSIDIVYKDGSERVFFNFLPIIPYVVPGSFCPDRKKVDPNVISEKTNSLAKLFYNMGWSRTALRNGSTKILHVLLFPVDMQLEKDLNKVEEITL